MSKKTNDKKMATIKEYDVRDNLQNRNLKMYIIEEDSIDFERTSSFFRKVEMAEKIIDADTGHCYKNKLV